MKIGILGTGIVGRTLSARLAGMDHTVMIGTRDPSVTLARTDTDSMGNPPFREWVKLNPGIEVGEFAKAAAHGEMVFNCTSGMISLQALGMAGEMNLNGKVIVDCSNPLDFSKGMPPTLSVSNTDSLGEQIQRVFPRAKVVKTLNTVNARLMTNPDRLDGGAHSVFICGEDAEAKVQVSELLKGFGWRDIIDLGGIGSARGVEMMLPLWARIFGIFQNPYFNFRIVR
jgi:8-hydroxy-5-deazaflavin:NADPH oxidoreductase